MQQGGGSPDGSAAIQIYVAGAFESPVRFVATWWRFVRSLAYVSGARVLETYVSAPTRAIGLLEKVTVHVAGDFLFIACLILAPFGVVLARRPADTSLLALWVLFATVLTGLAAHGGARYRSPLEPFLIVLGSIVLAGGWRRVTRRPLVTASLVSLLLMWLVLPQIPSALAGYPEYGVMDRFVVDGQRQLVVRSEAGIHVTPVNGQVKFEMASASSADRPMNVEIRVDGVHVATADVVPGVPREFDYLSSGPGAAFLELSTPGSGQSLRITTKSSAPGPR